jgi:DNA-binding transcriptional MerR regulator
MHKLYYSISEVSTIVDEEQHILRYWEKEFDGLKPKKNRGGNRIYSHKDLLIVQVIKKLIRTNNLSLKGAKDQLKTILKQNDVNLENLAQNNEIIQVQSNIPDNKSSVKSSGPTQQKPLITKEELKEISTVLEDALNFLKSN